jgi:hypothetical protein
MVSWSLATMGRALLLRVEMAVLSPTERVPEGMLAAAEEIFLGGVVVDVAVFLAAARLLDDARELPALPPSCDTFVGAARRLGVDVDTPLAGALAVVAALRAGKSLRPAYADLAAVYARREA